MTCSPVTRLMFLEYRSLPATLFGSIRTPGMEAASAWRIHRTWYIPFQNNTFSGSAKLWIRYRNRRKQGLCIWMDRMSVQLITLSQFHKGTKIHNTDSI